METKPAAPKTMGRKILSVLSISFLALFFIASTPAGIRFRDQLIENLSPKATYGVPTAEPTPTDCAGAINPEHPDWKCYEIPGAYKLFYSADWQVLTESGETGVFQANESNFSVTYANTASMPAQDVADLISGGADRRITHHAEILCEQTDACPKYISKTTATIDGQKVTMFEYTMNGDALGHPELSQEQRIMGIAKNNTYYQFLLLMPASITPELRAERVTEFMRMAKTFVIEAKAE